MAGSDPTPVTDIPLIDVDTLLHKIESQQDLLRDILDTLRLANRARTVIHLAANGTAATNFYRNHTRTFLETVIITGSTVVAGVTLDLMLGSIDHRFRLGGHSPVIFPFPIVIDRGIDCNAVFGAVQDPGDVYLIGTVE